MSTVTKEAVLQVLSNVQDPALAKSLASAMLLRDIEVDGGQVSLTLGLISPNHPHQAEMEAEIRQNLQTLDGVTDVQINTALDVPSDGKLRGMAPPNIKTVLAVASGKGGVGKSTVSVNTAVALAQAGAKVGLMDADVYGPNVPRMMGVEGARLKPNAQNRIDAVEAYGVKVMSIGFMVNPDQPVAWRGPMLHTAIRQFIHDVDWGEIDYLVIDLPPGTGDAQLSLSQTIAVTGSLIVTLPQQVSLDDARRGLEMFRQLGVPLLGICENMSYLELPDGQKMDVFGSGGGEKLASETNIPFIGAIPMDPAVREGGDSGAPILHTHPDSPVSQALREIAAQAALRTSVMALRNQSSSIPINIVG